MGSIFVVFPLAAAGFLTAFSRIAFPFPPVFRRV
jgi:hypothetical protein